MAKVAPFRGIRYNPDLVDLGQTTSPPYDVISPADRDYFHALHPKNMVRLILGLELPDDDETKNRFTRASSYLDEWLAEGTLIQDDKPAFYAYEQHYAWRGRRKTVRGFIAAVKLHDYADRVILPHENTLAKPKSHLVPLIRATNANLDSVYALYPDQEHVVDAILDRVAATAPLEEATDRQGVRHQLWKVNGEADIATITQTLADRQMVIADGHHRYETSLGYRDELRARDGNPADEQPYDYVMMTLVNVYAPDVIIFPTHRMVRNLSDDLLEGLDSSLGEMFELVPSGRESLLADMEARGGKAIGIYRSGRAYLAILKDGLGELIPGPAAAQSLDLNVLHQLILERSLGIDKERLRQEANVTYTRNEQEAMDRVDAGEYQVSFLLNPMRLEVVLEIAQAGEKMPQKATYFYPKLLSGLVMRRIG